MRCEAGVSYVACSNRRRAALTPSGEEEQRERYKSRLTESFRLPGSFRMHGFDLLERQREHSRKRVKRRREQFETTMNVAVARGGSRIGGARCRRNRNFISTPAPYRAPCLSVLFALRAEKKWAIFYLFFNIGKGENESTSNLELSIVHYAIKNKWLFNKKKKKSHNSIMKSTNSSMRRDSKVQRESTTTPISATQTLDVIVQLKGTLRCPNGVTIGSKI